MIREVDVQEFAAAQRRGALVVDVREPSEYADGHVPGAARQTSEDRQRVTSVKPT